MYWNTLWGRWCGEVKLISRKEKKKLGVFWGHIKNKWKDGPIILTADGISKLLIKRLTIKNMKIQVSRGLLLLFWCFEKIWLYGTIFKCHFIVLKNDRRSTLTKWPSWGDKSRKPPYSRFSSYVNSKPFPPWTKDHSLWEVGDIIQHAYARPTSKAGKWVP